MMSHSFYIGTACSGSIPKCTIFLNLSQGSSSINSSSINIPQPIMMTLQPYRFTPPCHRLSSFQVHQMVSSPFQVQQKQTRTKRCYTSIRGTLASPRQAKTVQEPTHRHMGYRPLATWKHSVSGRTRFSILSEIDSPSSLILPSYTSCCHPTFAPLQSTLSLGLG